MRPLPFQPMLNVLPASLLLIRRFAQRSAWAGFVLLMLCSIVNVTSAADAKPYPLTTCIVSGDKIDPSVTPIVHNNQQVKFCCKGCIKKFNACPDKYMVRLQGADAGKKK